MFQARKQIQIFPDQIYSKVSEEQNESLNKEQEMLESLVMLKSSWIQLACFIASIIQIMYPSGQGSFQPQANGVGSNQNSFNNSNSNLQQRPQFSNQAFLSPQAGSFNANKNVYASTIHASTSSSNLSRPAFGLSRLEAMGRTIKDDSDHIETRQQQVSSTSFANTANNFAFKSNNDKGKLASSVIFQKNFDQDINRFPGFNVNPTNNPQVGTSKLDALYAKKQTFQMPPQQQTTENVQDRRKRQIDAIKQELEVLNKRMESTVTKKGDGEAKPYFQLPTRKTPAMNNTSPASTFAETLKVSNTSTFSTQSTENSGAKALFDRFSKGSDTAPTAPIQNTLNTFSNPVKAEIKVEPKAAATSPIVPAATVKTEAGGMFKKKNPYLSDESAKIVEHAPKTFMLSPKGATLNQGFKAQSTAPKLQAKVQTRAAQVYEPVQTKKGIKRTSSSQNLSQGPKQFKKTDFAIGKKMGKGQFGEVMLVIHKQTGFLCGMKVMSKKQIREEKYVNQIARQLSIQFYLNHRNVAPLYGYFEDEENVYLLIEYCTGGQLLQLLRKAHRMEEADASPIIREICQGLDYIHKEEIIHRDIKPENILFNFNTVKICDFGWAVHCGSGMRKTVSGSPLYYSPEIVQETQYDEKVDIWAIGMMTYQCLLGKIPFKIYSELDLNRIVEDEVKFPEYIDVTEDAKSFILGIMQKNPDDRMVMKDIFKHPFIKKYLAQRKVASDIIEEFRRVLN